MTTRCSSQDISRVAWRLRGLPVVNQAVAPGSNFVTPALKVLDAVLSLNRRYNEFVVPAINRFAIKHPDVGSLTQLQDKIEAYGGHRQFFDKGLCYHDAKRANVLAGVLKYLQSVTSKYTGTTESDRLRTWAISVSASDFSTTLTLPDGMTTNVYGFGLAGWQYLRMLFGADTCKPDRMIRRFVADCLNVKNVSDAQALDIVEKAAPLAGIPVAEADRRIWNNRKQGGPGCVGHRNSTARSRCRGSALP